MRFMIDDIEVLFPYDYIYPEQYEYMIRLRQSLSEGHALLEMPTGTGKTITLLSLLLAYQYKYVDCGKIIYCTRTVQEMDKVVDEMKHVMGYRTKIIDEDRLKDASLRESSILGVCLSSRRNLCVHPEISKFDSRNRVDAMCRNLTASFVREKKQSQPETETCQYYDGFQQEGLEANVQGIYTISDLRASGTTRGWCPYYWARHLINQCNVIVYNYQYMLDPKISGMVSKEFDRDSIIVFDEAHNIDNICIEALSVTIDRQIVRTSHGNLKKLEREIKQMEVTNSQRLHDEYNSLVAGLSATQPTFNASDMLQGSPTLDNSVFAEAMPGNIRKARNFIVFLRTLVEYLNRRLLNSAVKMESPTAFLADFQASQLQYSVDSKALKFSFDRLQSLFRTLELVNLDEYSPLTQVTNFATLVATYSEGFVVLYEPAEEHAGILESRLQLCCLDPSLAIRPVFQRYKSVVITSGTLSPLDMYPRMLDFHPAICEALQMSMTRNCVCPLIVSKGADQLPISTQYKSRDDPSVLINYGRLLIELCACVPDGIVAFFTSYRLLEDMVAGWYERGITKQILEHKLIFIETKDIVETTLALDAYKRACDCGRGALFLSVARGKVAEGVDFDRHYGRCVIMLGIPFQYTKSRVLQARLQYLNEKHNIREADFLTFDALRQTSQCFTADHQLLTKTGFKWVADVTDTDYIATFNEDTKRIEYHLPSAVIHRPLMPDEHLIEFQSSAERLRWDANSTQYGKPVASNSTNIGQKVSNLVSLVVTGDHTMYVQRGRDYRTPTSRSHKFDATWSRLPAQQLVSSDAQQLIRVLSLAANGATTDLSSRLQTLQQSSDTKELDDRQRSFDFVKDLQLTTADQFNAFLELYGYWLGDGSINYRVYHTGKGANSSGNVVTVYSRTKCDQQYLIALFDKLGLQRDQDYQVRDQKDDSQDVHIANTAWFDYFHYRYGVKYLHGKKLGGHISCSSAAEGELTVKSAKWMLEWVWELHRDEARSVLTGLRIADGTEVEGDENRITTSSVSFRDSLVHLALHAGFTTYFKLDGATGAKRGMVQGGSSTTEATAQFDHWLVLYTDRFPNHVLRPSTDIQQSPVAYTGNVHCVTVPNHLVIARRANANDEGVITKASRPVVVGQCVGRVIRSKTDYGIMVFADQRFTKWDKQNKLPGWVRQFLDVASQAGISTDRAVNTSREFLRQIAQPRTRAEELGVTMLTQDALLKHPITRKFQLDIKMHNAMELEMKEAEDLQERKEKSHEPTDDELAIMEMQMDDNMS